MFRSIRTALSIAVLLGLALPALAYIDLAPTLGNLVRQSQSITLVEVSQFNHDQGKVILKKVRDLKGQTNSDTLKHQVLQGKVVPRHILEWAEPGRRGVVLTSSTSALVCLGRNWYQVQNSGNGWWTLGVERPDLPLAYCGTVSRLCDALELMVAGKTAVIAMVPHGNSDGAASVDLALNRPALPGLVKLQRIRANIRMPQNVMAVSANPAYLVGEGAVGEEEIPALIQKLQFTTDATVRAGAADDLRTLGTKAVAAASTLSKLLDDPTPRVRMSAAAALANITQGDGRCIDILTKGLSSTEAIERRHAARATGLAGAAATPLVGKLATLLADSDELVRLAALQAVAMLGPAGAGALDGVVKLLDDPQTAIDAADALGRMGPAARPAMKRLARMLSSDAAPTRWAAVRAMSQIGGPDAAPAVQFMIRQLPNASEVDGYNMMIYLALLGPVAKDAVPAIQNARIKQPVLRPAALWAIDPQKSFPWQGGFGMPMGDGNIVASVYDCIINEMGDQLKPVARKLAQQIMAGTAGEVPTAGYRMLARFPGETLNTLSAGLTEKELIRRERAVVALGYMGPAAAPAKAAITAALAKATNEKEQKLMRWCLREIGG